MTSGRWTQIKSRWLEEVFMKLGRNVKTCPDRNVWNSPKKSLLTRQIQGGTSSFRWRWPSLSLLSRSHTESGAEKKSLWPSKSRVQSGWLDFFCKPFRLSQCNAMQKSYENLLDFQCKDFVATCMTATRYFCRSWNQQQKALNVLWHPNCLFPFQDTFLIILSSCKYHFNWYFYLYTMDIFV